MDLPSHSTPGRGPEGGAASSASAPVGPRTSHLERRSPRRFGCLFAGLLGCGGFLFGAVLAGLIFAPRLFSGLAAAGLERHLNEDVRGHVSIGSVLLAWTDPLQVEDLLLRDEAGAELLRLSAKLPSILEMFDSSREFQLDLDIQQALVDIDAEGMSNIARALGPELVFRWGSWQGGQGDPMSAVGPRPLSLSVAARNVSWREEGWPEGLRAFTPRARLKLESASSRWSMEGRVELTGGYGEGAEWGSLLDLEARAGVEGGSWTDLDLAFSGEQLDMRWWEVLVGQGLASELTPERIDIDVTARGDAQAGAPVVARLRGPQREVTLDAQWQRGRLVMTEGQRHQLQLPAARVQRLAALLLPAQMSLALADQVALDLTLERLELPLGWGTTSPVPDPLSRLDGVLSLGLAGQVPLRKDGVGLMTLLDPGVEVTITQAGTLVDMSARIATREMREGSLEMKLRATEPLVEWLGGSGRPHSSSISSVAMPSRFLDAVAEQSGVVTEMFGEDLSLDLVMQQGAEVGGAVELELRLESEQARLDLEGHLASGTLVSDGALTLEFPLGPLAAERLLEHCMPWCERLEATSGDQAAQLQLSKYELPLSGDWRELAGEAVLHLPPVRYEYTAALEDVLRAAGRESIEAEDLAVYVSFERGRVEYDALPLYLDGTPTEFDGTIDLRDGTVALEGSPSMQFVLGMLGRKMEQVPQGLEFPVRLTGTLGRVDVELSIGVIRDMIDSGVDAAWLPEAWFGDESSDDGR